ncbi:MAG TPA: hypothetical protein VN783_15015 [Thermoanaerobaculia bacterium]|nr:hypothetical protein [Thermoanaerobaculia bacterium]
MSPLLLATPFLPLLVYLPGGRWLLPLVAPLTLYPSFRRLVREGDVERAWLAGIAWAALLSLGVIALTQSSPGAAGAGILRGEPYRIEMFGWIATGVAPENSPRLFVPQLLLHLGLFLVLTWISGGYLGLVLGAALVDYMSYFVGSYALAAHTPFLGSILAWVPWSVIRVGAFVLLGALFARPLLVRRLWPFERRDRPYFALAATGIALDLIIKTLAAPAYGRFLHALAQRAGGSIVP